MGLLSQFQLFTFQLSDFCCRCLLFRFLCSCVLQLYNNQSVFSVIGGVWKESEVYVLYKSGFSKLWFLCQIHSFLISSAAVLKLSHVPDAPDLILPSHFQFQPMPISIFIPAASVAHTGVCKRCRPPSVPPSHRGYSQTSRSRCCCWCPRGHPAPP